MIPRGRVKVVVPASRAVGCPSRTAAGAIARLLVVSAVLTAVTSPASAREKVDVIVIDNGDRITCEIKTLERGVLQVKTDAMGTIYIEWENVDRVTSPQLFQVEDREGRKFFGTLAGAVETRSLVVAGTATKETLHHPEVVRIAAIDEVWTDRIKGSIDLGLDAKTASNETSYTLGASSSYRTREFLAELDLESSITSLTDVPTTVYNDLSFQYNR